MKTKIDIIDAAVMALRLEVHGSGKVATADGTYQIRLHLEATLTDEELECMPIGEAAGRLVELARERAGDDGPNVDKVAMRREYDLENYMFTLDLEDEGITSLDLDGVSVVRTPVFAVVEGQASLRWWIQTTILKNRLTDVADLIDREGYKLTMMSTQPELFDETTKQGELKDQTDTAYVM